MKEKKRLKKAVRIVNSKKIIKKNKKVVAKQIDPIKDISEHIGEMKRRVLTTIIIFAIFFIICMFFGNDLMKILIDMIKNKGFDIVSYSAQEVLVQQLRLCGIIAILLTFPIIIYEISAFVFPVIENKKTKKTVVLMEILSVLMFVIGAGFALWQILPFTLGYLYEFGKGSGIKAQVSLKEYYDLIKTFTFCIGFIFEMPLISMCLCKIGILSSKILKTIRPIAIVLIFIIAAIITPPDVISQIMVGIPMIVLYEVSIITGRFMENRDLVTK